ncbi:flagellin lysine-N-methylase [Blautia sp. MSJ-19]|uniref:flagellin lysine-N-methylase n=1 Tax=Blautia sp. MSJ-19 TaxID=2841517 RepID=UPI001C0EE48D|nr:flagellin lysine-N-methylase [Blautia sp. MSJ-19]MBU5480132.1 flagellin lysine-N-methylase [Blautia sp. MSJ-19]
MQITKPVFYKEFSCIAGACPDTCCAGWQIMIDDRSLKKYHRYKGVFRNRLHNDIDWKEQSFRQYDHRCAFLNEENLCDMYSEAGQDMLCDTCRKYPRHIEEFEGLREYSLSLSCPEAARIFLSHNEKLTFVTREVPAPEETYDDFDYLLFTALMDTREYLFTILQNRSVPVKLRRQKLLACTHDFQLSLDKNELFQWEDIRQRHLNSGFGDRFQEKISAWSTGNAETADRNDRILLVLYKHIWKTVIPQMEVLRPGWHAYLQDTLTPLYTSCKNDADLLAVYREFEAAYPAWSIQEEQLLLYWIYTYFCGAVYDDRIFAKVKMAVICTFIIHELAVGTFLRNDRKFSFEEMVSICYRFSRELEHSDPNLNEMERLMDEAEIFRFENLLII